MAVFKKEKLIRFCISLSLSMFTWGVVTNMYNPFQTKTLNNVPVKILNSESLESQNLAIDSKTLSEVSVTVGARYSDMQNVSTSDVEILMDLKDLALKEGTNTVALTAKSLNSNIQVIEEKTSMQLKIEVVKLLQKDVPIIVNATGSLPDGYISGEPILSKESIICTGTKEELNNIKYVTANIDLANANTTIDESIALKVINKVGDESKSVALKEKEIQIKVPIYYTKTVPIEVDISKSTPLRYSLDAYSLDTQSISIYGDKEKLDSITSVTTEKIDLSRRYYDFEKKLDIVFPEGVFASNNVSSVYASFVIKKS